MSFLRARQRTKTALFPHQANPTHLIPKRRAGAILVGATHKITQITLVFGADVTGIDEIGFRVTQNGNLITTTAAANGNANEIVVTHDLVVLGDVTELTYTTGNWISKGLPLGGFISRGDVV